MLCLFVFCVPVPDQTTNKVQKSLLLRKALPFFACVVSEFFIQTKLTRSKLFDRMYRLCIGTFFDIDIDTTVDNRDNYMSISLSSLLCL